MNKPNKKVGFTMSSPTLSLQVSGMVLPMSVLGGITISMVPLFFFLLPPVISKSRCMSYLYLFLSLYTNIYIYIYISLYKSMRETSTFKGCQLTPISVAIDSWAGLITTRKCKLSFRMQYFIIKFTVYWQH